MLTYDKIKMLCKKKGVTITGTEKELGFARGSLCKVDTNKPSAEKVQKLANFFDVSVEYLMEEQEKGITTCTDCGLLYDSSYPGDIKSHQMQHSAWKKAAEKFGELYCYYPEREKIKAENRKISHDTSLSLKERCDAQIKVLRCLFSRSVEANEYDLRHVPFETYISLMLGNDTYRKNLEDDVYQVLYDKYGTKSGMNYGTIYHIPVKKISTITKKDERDIKRDLENLREKLINKEFGPAAYDGQELPDEDIDLFLGQVDLMLRRVKAKNKEKYNLSEHKK